MYFPLRTSINPKVYPHLRICENLYKADRFTLDRLEHIQLQQLNRIASHARKYSKFYHGRLKPCFSSLSDFSTSTPTLSRNELRDSLAEIQAIELPPGVEVTSPIYSSGSTGTPIQVLQTNVSNAWYRAFHLRDLAWQGLDIRKNIAAIKYYAKPNDHYHGMHVPHWDTAIHQFFNTGSAYLLSIERDPHFQYNKLHQVKPDYLSSYPSNLESLIDVGELPDSIQAIKCYSEPLGSELEQRLGANHRVYDTYSAMEVGYMASTCMAGGLHVHSEGIILEVVNENGKACKPGETGKVLVTTLYNHATPLIRYEIGDYATVGTPCPCGKAHPVLERVDGKIHPLFKLKNGTYKNSIELPVIFRKVGGYKQYQVVHSRERVLINLIPNTEWSKDKEAEIREKFQRFFESDIPIVFEEVDRIPLHKGKRRHLVTMN